MIFRPYLLPVARGLALFLALFTLLNILGDRFSSGFDANNWWIDLGRGGGSQLALVVSALALLFFAMRPLKSRVICLFVQLPAIFLIVVTLLNSLSVYSLMFSGAVRFGFPVPVSLLIALSLCLILLATFARSYQPSSFKTHILFGLTFVFCLVAFPLAQIYCFGKTDYRRPADAIVVFGALARPDGTPSQALFDRVNTAIALYHEGYASLLIFTGGPSAGELSEPDVMRKMAVAAGVPDSAIILDQDGLNTDASVANTVPLFRQHDIRSVLAVSHFYHLPRIKMTYARALHEEKGVIEVFTVPARETRMLIAMPRFIFREVLALYAYYLRPLHKSFAAS